MSFEERRIAKLIEHCLKLRVHDKQVVRDKVLREGLQSLWKTSDLTAGELCDAFELTMDQLSHILNEDFNRKRAPNVWDENLKSGLPLFIPIKITGI